LRPTIGLIVFNVFLDLLLPVVGHQSFPHTIWFTLVICRASFTDVSPAPADVLRAPAELISRFGSLFVKTLSSWTKPNRRNWSSSTHKLTMQLLERTETNVVL
jgi:hypothetical protein